MEKIDVIKLVRENQDKFKQHLEKMKELEEKEKELDYYHQYKNYPNNERLTTIPEGENETYSVKKTAYIDENSIIKSTKTKKSNINFESDQEIKSDNNSKNSKNYGDNKINHDKLNIIKRYTNINYPLDKANENEIENNNSFELSQSLQNEKNAFQQEQDEKYNYRSDDDVDGDEEIEKYDSEDNFKNINNMNVKNKMNKIYDDSDSGHDINSDDDAGKNASANDSFKKINKTKPLSNNYNLTRSNSTLKSSQVQAQEENKLQYIKKEKIKIADNIDKANNKNGINEKRPYTAYTYSTIKKMKTCAKETKKPSLFQEKVLNSKKYNGKSDRVALYQQTKTYWDKKPFLSNIQHKVFNNKDSLEIKPEIDILEKIKLQKLNNMKRPLKHYLKYI